MALDQTRANEILAWMHAGTAPPTNTSANRLKLLTAIGNATTPGTEVATGGGYTQVAAGTTGGIALSWAAASAGSQATNAVAQVTNYPRAESVAAVEVYDNNATTPRRIEYGAITGGAKAMSAGDTLSFASGAITSALA